MGLIFSGARRGRLIVGALVHDTPPPGKRAARFGKAIHLR